MWWFWCNCDLQLLANFRLFHYGWLVALMVSDSGLLWWFVGEFAFGCFLLLVVFWWFSNSGLFWLVACEFGWFACGWCGFAILCLVTGF